MAVRRTTGPKKLGAGKVMQARRSPQPAKRRAPKALPAHLRQIWQRRVAQPIGRRGAGSYWEGYARRGAAPKGGRTVSKAQQKWGFANRMPWAHPAARRGPDYDRLPEHKRRRG